MKVGRVTAAHEDTGDSFSIPLTVEDLGMLKTPDKVWKAILKAANGTEECKLVIEPSSGMEHLSLTLDI
jgi:hypothetical protein